jgi:hypothetical protein
MFRFLRFVAPILLGLLLQGCAAPYFRAAPGAAPEPHALALERLPWTEYWTGIVFNGNRIGFTHLQLARESGTPDTWILRSDAALRFRFLMLDKRVALRAEDRVNSDLTLQSFSYDYELDGSRLQLEGTASDGGLVVRITGRGGTTEQRLAVTEPLYPSSAINLFAALRGLHTGGRHEFLVYDGESQRLARVEQRVTGYETSDLFTGAAWKLHTRLHGQGVNTWINDRAEPVFELGMNGILIAALEDADEARRYLADAALNKDEALLDFSRVPIDGNAIPDGNVTQLDIALRGVPQDMTVPSDARQKCDRAGAHEVRCTVAIDTRQDAAPSDPDRWLQSSVAVPNRHPRIVELARQLTGSLNNAPDRLAALLDWMRANIEPAPADVFTALDVLEEGRAECQGLSFLFASLARSLDIPARVANGLVYSVRHGGFLYHAWVEAWTGDRWQAVDPTFGQLTADATHIKLLEGENLADLAVLIPLIGRLSARIFDASAGEGGGP